MFSTLHKDSIDSVSSVLENGANAGVVDWKERQKRLVGIVERLLKEFHVEPDCKDTAGFTALMFACEHGHIELVQKLIAYKADVSASNGEGVNALLLAIVNSLPRTVEYLLKNGKFPFCLKWFYYSTCIE